MTHGRAALIDAWLALRASRSGSDDERFWQQRVRALGAALGVTQGLGARPSDTAPREMSALADLAESTAKLLAGVRTPFEGYLEAPQEVIALMHRYREDIDGAADRLRAELRRLLDATLAVVWGLPESRLVTREQVLAYGVDLDERLPRDFEDDLY